MSAAVSNLVLARVERGRKAGVGQATPVAAATPLVGRKHRSDSQIQSTTGGHVVPEMQLTCLEPRCDIHLIRSQFFCRFV